MTKPWRNPRGGKNELYHNKRFSLYICTIFLLLLIPTMILMMNPYDNSGRYEDNFIEGRRKHLQKWLTHVTAHPVLSYSNTLKHFLSVTDKDVIPF